MKGRRLSPPGGGSGDSRSAEGRSPVRSRKKPKGSSPRKRSAGPWFRLGFGRNAQPAGPPGKRKHRHRSARRSRASWKVAASLVAVCALAALLFAAVQRISLIDVASFFLFGTTDPYISPEREQEMQKEFRDMIQKEFGARKSREVR